MLLVLLHNNLKKKKRKYKTLIEPLLNSKHKRRLITPCLLHLATVQWRPTVPRSWTGYNFSNKDFGIEVMLQIEAKITEMSTAPRSGTLHHDAYPAVARQSRGATGGDYMKPGMSVAPPLGNATNCDALPFSATVT
jgi:hypothetical protein